MKPILIKRGCTISEHALDASPHREDVSRDWQLIKRWRFAGNYTDETVIVDIWDNTIDPRKNNQKESE